MNTVIVFTAKDVKKTIEQGGSGNWKLNAERVKKCHYVLLTANSHHRESTHPRSKHGHAFLIGKISVPIPEAYDDLGNKEDNRWIIQFDEYAEIDIPGAWGGYQNPVKYADLSDFSIDTEDLDWKPFPKDQIINRAHLGVRALTIEEAKLGISKKLGVPANCIEITIRA
ncbi:MAG TPA: hypothetical protein ENI64_04160 [Gammaproteobacteria bacterium]|nr:hypothetical protein [Gammaproteobacteria bacterium]